MDRQKLQMLRSLPIEGVAERLGLRVTRHKCLCPFHEDSHPSLSFLVRKNTFRCFVCGASGGVIDLAMKVLGKDFKDACRWLADEHNIIAATPQPATQAEPAAAFDASRYEGFFRNPRLSQPARDFLFSQRQLDSRVVSWCRLTSWQDREGHGYRSGHCRCQLTTTSGEVKRNLPKRKGSPLRLPSFHASADRKARSECVDRKAADGVTHTFENSPLCLCLHAKPSGGIVLCPPIFCRDLGCTGL